MTIETINGVAFCGDFAWLWNDVRGVWPSGNGGKSVLKLASSEHNPLLVTIPAPIRDTLAAFRAVIESPEVAP